MAAELPKKYKALVYDKPGSISTKIEELDMPEPAAGQVLINLYGVVRIPRKYIANSLQERTAVSATQTWAS